MSVCPSIRSFVTLSGIHFSMDLFKTLYSFRGHNEDVHVELRCR